MRHSTGRYAKFSAWAAGAATLALLVPAAASARPGDLDPRFSKDGKAFPGSELIHELHPTPDGGVIVTAEYGGIRRLTASGRPDRGFGRKGILRIPDGAGDCDGGPCRGTPEAVTVEQDGKILGAETTSASYSSTSWTLGVARFFSDGSLDSGFASGGLAEVELPPQLGALAVTDLQRLDDGAIMVTGTTSYGGPAALIRLRSDGTLDETFAGDGILESAPDALDSISLVIGPAGSVYVAGAAFDPAHPERTLTRIGPTGLPDSGFDSAPFAERDAFAVGIRPRPGGGVGVLGASAGTRTLELVEPDGTIDPAFEAAAQPRAVDFAIGSDASIYTIGSDRSSAVERAEVARLTPAGQPDPAFSGDGVARVGFRGVSTYAETIAVDSQGRVLVGSETGSTIEDDTYASVARLRVDGGPPDADADGVLDGDDRCPEQFGPRSRAGCDAIRRKVGIHVGGKGFRGPVRCAYNRRLGSIRPGLCVRVGRVTVFKRRPGRDRVVGRTDAEYTWRLRAKVGNGRYYARLSAVRARDLFIYGGDISGAVRVRGRSSG